jgi:branched-subunit amino acid ABC-type transport system permease component
VSTALLLEQLLNGLQYGVFLFLVSAGLTLVFGIMNFVNLAHGTLFMLGAYAAAAIYAHTGSFMLAWAGAPIATSLIAGALERLLIRHAYARDHLVQVMVTFGLLLFFNQLMIVLFGPASQPLDIPAFLNRHIELLPGTPYPAFRLAIIGVGVVIAAGLYVIIARTRLGAMVRAGASNRVMLDALGVNVNALYAGVFCAGAALAGLAGVMAGPILSVEPGMGDEILILAFVVIVIGGIGSVRGALVASVIVGIVEVMGRSSLKTVLVQLLGDSPAQTAAPAIASMAVYLLMVLVLFFRPQGLFPARTG